MRFYIPESELQPLTASSGFKSYHLWQMFPFMEYFISDYEKNWDMASTKEAWTNTEYVPLVLVAIYMICIFGGQKIMASRQAFDLRTPLAYWNLFLSLFSFMGMFRVAPYLFYYTATMNYRDINCIHPSITHGHSDVGLWTTLFLLSKAFELFDTMFIVLRKKPLIFLHWYHHVTVLLYCYYSGMHAHSGLYFVAMNYTVHSFMYGYFYLMAIKKVPKWFNPLWITIMQISQMFVGVFVVLSMTYFKFFTSEPCEGAQEKLLYAGLAMYGSYLYLFVEFAVKRFILAPRRTRALALAEKQAAVAADSNAPAPIPKLEKGRSTSCVARFVRQNSAYDIDVELVDDALDSATDTDSDHECNTVSEQNALSLKKQQ